MRRMMTYLAVAIFVMALTAAALILLTSESVSWRSGNAAGAGQVCLSIRRNRWFSCRPETGITLRHPDLHPHAHTHHRAHHTCADRYTSRPNR